MELLHKEYITAQRARARADMTLTYGARIHDIYVINVYSISIPDLSTAS